MSSQAPLQKYPEPAPNGTSLSPRDVPKLAASNAEQVKANTTGVIPSSVSAEKRTAPVGTGVSTSDSAKTKIAPTEVSIFFYPFFQISSLHCHLWVLYAELSSVPPSEFQVCVLNC